MFSCNMCGDYGSFACSDCKLLTEDLWNIAPIAELTSNTIEQIAPVRVADNSPINLPPLGSAETPLNGLSQFLNRNREISQTQ